MNLYRPDYGEAGTATERAKMLFSNLEVEIPKFDYPITPLENFRRVTSKNSPMWAPNALSDFQTLLFQDLADGEQQVGENTHIISKEDYTFTDWFGVPMTWSLAAGGAINTPGVHLLDDISKWEKSVKFPVLSDWDWHTKAEMFKKNEYDPNKVLQIDLHNGCIQRLILLMGGYTEGMLALAEEPEAVRDLFDRIADHMIELVDLLCSLYPVNLMTIHDDWGTERDTFFSPKMMEEIVFEPTKRIISHIKSKGVSYMQHSCGNTTRFIPYMIDMGADFLQIQRRAVDIPAMKAKYGDKIGFTAGIEGFVPANSYTKSEIVERVRDTVNKYCSGGGFFASIYGGDPETIWNIVCELYAYSREFYGS